MKYLIKSRRYEMPPEWVCPFFPNPALAITFTILLVVWSIVWKGIALWRAGSNRHVVWFIVLFIINTAGILEIIYIFAVSRRR